MVPFPDEVDLMRISVVGAEVEVFRGAREMIPNVKKFHMNAVDRNFHARNRSDMQVQFDFPSNFDVRFGEDFFVATQDSFSPAMI